MRHRVGGRKLQRTSSHRAALWGTPNARRAAGGSYPWPFWKHKRHGQLPARGVLRLRNVVYAPPRRTGGLRSSSPSRDKPSALRETFIVPPV